MTQEQKEKCSMIWEGYTGYIIEPHHWNEEAADILAEYVGEVIKCTHGMAMFKAVFTSFPKRLSWRDLARIPAKLIKAHIEIKIKMGDGFMNRACKVGKSVDGYKTAIEVAIMNGKR